MWLIRFAIAILRRTAAAAAALPKKESRSVFNTVPNQERKIPVLRQTRPPPTSWALSKRGGDVGCGMWDGWVGTKRSPFPPACLSVPPPLRPFRASGAERKSMHAMRCDGYPAPTLLFIFYLLPERANVPQTDRESESESETKTLRAALLRTQCTSVLRTNVAFFPSGKKLSNASASAYEGQRAASGERRRRRRRRAGHDASGLPLALRVSRLDTST
jgi:hypothetical protein